MEIQTKIETKIAFEIKRIESKNREGKKIQDDDLKILLIASLVNEEGQDANEDRDEDREVENVNVRT